jgi:glucosamine--fructose-6-phosphate aminotransferase (isomerizing)
MAKEQVGLHTLTEISSQPETWSETVQSLNSNFKGKIPDFRKYDHVFFTGCGSTHYLSIWASRLFQKKLKISSHALPASELWYANSDWTSPYKKPLLIAVSRSGETTETIRAVEVFKQNGFGDVISVTCYPESNLSKISDLSISTPAGKEKSIAQTRSFTNMMCAVLFLIDSEVPEIVVENFGNISRKYLDHYQQKAKEIGRDSSFNRFFFLGDGPLFGLANEAMLKQKEMSLSYAEAYHFMEFRHGPMSMVDPQSVVIGLFSSWAEAFEIAVVSDMKKLNSKTIGVGNLEKSDESLDTYFMLPELLPSHWLFPLYLPVLQLIAYERSIAKGLDPDKPNNLSAVIEL